MADKAPEQEPSIEEILASIRQIISDDDEDSEPKADKAPETAASPPSLPPAPEPDVLELTEVVKDEAPPPATKPPIEVVLRDAVDEEPETPPPPKPKPASPPTQPTRPAMDKGDNSLLTDQAANAALAGFSRLVSHTPVERADHPGGITLEDIVRELMRPLLREWLDEHLPPLIEKLVERELEKLAQEAKEGH